MNPNPSAARAQIVEKMRASGNILVTVSRNPSIDQLAACIAVTLLLNKAKKNATAVFGGKVPSAIEFLNPMENIAPSADSLRDFIIAIDKSKADKLRYKLEDDVVKIFITPYRTNITEKDLKFSAGEFNIDVILALGVQHQQDLDDAISAHGRILHDAIVISMNNLPGGDFGVANWEDVQQSSISEMVASLAPEMGQGLIDPTIATALLTGIVAETGRFSNEKTHPSTMAVSAQLLAAGADQKLVNEKLQAAIGIVVNPGAGQEVKPTVEVPLADQETAGGPLEELVIDEHGKMQQSDNTPAAPISAAPAAPAPVPDTPAPAPAAATPEPATESAEPAPAEQVVPAPLPEPEAAPAAEPEVAATSVQAGTDSPVEPDIDPEGPLESTLPTPVEPETPATAAEPVPGPLPEPEPAVEEDYPKIKVEAKPYLADSVPAEGAGDAPGAEAAADPSDQPSGAPAPDPSADGESKLAQTVHLPGPGSDEEKEAEKEDKPAESAEEPPIDDELKEAATLAAQAASAEAAPAAEFAGTAPAPGGANYDSLNALLATDTSPIGPEAEAAPVIGAQPIGATADAGQAPLFGPASTAQQTPPETPPPLPPPVMPVSV